MKLKILLLLVVMCASLCAADVQSPIGFFKGYSWGTFGQKGDYIGPKAEESMKVMTQTGANAVSVVFAMSMQKKDSTEILYADKNLYMASDDDVRNAIRLGKENNLKVMLKPTIICNDGAWRAHIEPNDWNKWWGNYSDAMVHYAKLAQDTNCIAYCIGCEMVSTEDSDSHWRRMIGEIRKVYKGALVYNTNHGREDKINWWDAVDIIGISAYYPVGTTTIDAALAEDVQNVQKKSSLEQMKKNWLPIREHLKALSQKWNKPIFFAEIGVRSAKGSSSMPWEYYNDWPYDADEQARYYQAALETFWDEPWFVGFAWWAWHSELYPKEHGLKDRGFCPYAKPAEKIVTEWYHKERN
jgi:hypothetical protein